MTDGMGSMIGGMWLVWILLIIVLALAAAALATYLTKR